MFFNTTNRPIADPIDVNVLSLPDSGASTDEVVEMGVVQDQKPAATNGGSVGTINTWFSRTLNTISSSSAPWLSLFGVTGFTIDGGMYPGVYLITWRSPFIQTALTTTRLLNLTTGFVEAYGSSTFIDNAYLVRICADSVGSYATALSGITSWSVQYNASAIGPSPTITLGQSRGFGPEVYTEVQITRLVPLTV